MSQVVIGLDIAKSWFQADWIDAVGVQHAKKMARSKVLPWLAEIAAPALVAMEACASAHHWAREIAKQGHQVRLLPPSLVKPYVVRGKKNDSADASAIREALGRPNIHFVPIKTEEQQGVLALHDVREMLIGQRTCMINAVRAHFSEYGTVVPRGRHNVADLIELTKALPSTARSAVNLLFRSIDDIDLDIEEVEAELMAFHKTSPQSQNVASIPGIGPITATLIVAKVGDVARFSNGRRLASWLGLVPRQNSSGGKEKLGHITKAGDRAIRKALFLGALSMVWRAKSGTWAARLADRKPARVAAIAMANKLARAVWCVLSRGSAWQAEAPAA